MDEMTIGPDILIPLVPAKPHSNEVKVMTTFTEQQKEVFRSLGVSETEASAHADHWREVSIDPLRKSDRAEPIKTPLRWGDEGPAEPKREVRPVVHEDEDPAVHEKRGKGFLYAFRQIQAMEPEDEPLDDPVDLVGQAQFHIDEFLRDEDSDGLAQATRCLMRALELKTNPDSVHVRAANSRLRFAE